MHNVQRNAESTTLLYQPHIKVRLSVRTKGAQKRDEKRGSLEFGCDIVLIPLTKTPRLKCFRDRFKCAGCKEWSRQVYFVCKSFQRTRYWHFTLSWAVPLERRRNCRRFCVPNVQGVHAGIIDKATIRSRGEISIVVYNTQINLFLSTTADIGSIH